MSKASFMNRALVACLAFVITYVAFYAGITSIALNQAVFIFGWINIGVWVYKIFLRLEGYDR